MQANLILPLQASVDTAPRAAGNSLGDAVGQAQGGGFFAQLQQAGQQLQNGHGNALGGQGNSGGQQGQLPPELLALIDAKSIDHEGSAFSAEVAITASQELPEVEVDPEQVLAMMPVAGGEQVRVALGEVASGGKALPPEGAVLPQSALVKGVGKSVASDVAPELELTVEADGSELADQPQLNASVHERRLPALDRARFDLSQSADAIRQHLGSVPGGKPELTVEQISDLKAQGLLPDKVVANIAAVSDTTTLATGGLTTTPASTAAVTDAVRATTANDPGMSRPQIVMNTPMGEPGWAEEMGTRLRVLTERGSQTAEIRLNPPELGSMEVKITSDGERTSVTFFAQNSATRDALEAAMPRLREMFGDSGLQLADANVSDQQSMSQRDDTPSQSGGGPALLDEEGDAGLRIGVTASSDKLVDYYI